jgi:hypothetical protein
VQQPADIQLVVNLKAARDLGLDIPPAVVGRADEVIDRCAELHRARAANACTGYSGTRSRFFWQANFMFLHPLFVAICRMASRTLPLLTIAGRVALSSRIS